MTYCELEIEYAPRSENTMTYDEALLYCQFYNHGGHADWRMMTYDEWLPGLGWCYVNEPRFSKLNYVTPVRDK